ncbi:MAG: nickel-responsive transcriptional regulator NikR [Myxococcales bacterium]|jgi:CopG family nickel-responsive transcriptional regulator
MLERVGISLDDTLLEQFDRLIRSRGYENRSEAVRDLIREKLVEREWESVEQDEERVAVVMLVYDHESSSLAQKLTHIQHEHHRTVVSALHVHLDAHNCLEVLILRGKGSELLAMGDSLVSAKGVKYGRVMPATTGRNLP